MIRYEESVLMIALILALILALIFIGYLLLALRRAKLELRQVLPRPAEEQPTEAGEEKTAQAEAEANASAPTDSLLLVGNNDNAHQLLASQLSEDFRVYTPATASQALELVQEVNPDIVVSDVLMEGMRGEELCRRLKRSIETSHIPVVLLSRLGESIDIIHGLEAGATDYIVKPFDLSVLKARLHNILLNRQRLRKAILDTEEHVKEANLDTNDLDREFLDKALSIIHAELANADFSIVELGRRLAMSRTAVFNKIKSLTGQTPNEFIRIIRLNHAKELLLTHRYHLNEVALMVGFPDDNYFSTRFKRQFGLSPSQV
jgi:DNA-binding response OmpR family regulator